MIDSRLIQAHQALKEEAELVVAEGTLTLGKRGALVLTGSARPLDRGKADKDLPAGGALIEGEAVAGKFRHGKDAVATLAIRNGASLILVTGKVPADGAPKGVIRAVGWLKPADGGTLLLEATAVTALGK